MAHKSNNAEFLQEMRERFIRAQEAERDLREEFERDICFLAGEQWDDKTKRDRESANRPALTFNRMPGFVAQVSNECRQNKNQIKFNAADNGADKDTAEVAEGLARHIQYDSDADVAYETALEYSAGGSFGYVRLLSGYIADDSFNQELKVGTVDDPLSVYGVLVPACLGQKCPWAFVVKRITKDQYRIEYGDSDPDMDIAQLSLGDDTAGDWVTDQDVRIAEYWWLEQEKRSLVTLTDGRTLYEDEIPEGEEFEIAEDKDGKPQRRQVVVDTVHSCTTNGVEILDDTETEWPDPAGEIPIYAVLGKKLIVNGKPRLFSVIRFTRDLQQLFNFYKTAIAETLSLAPKAPYIMAEGQDEGHEHEWQTANTHTYSRLLYKPRALDGTPVGPPQRNVYESPIQGLSAAAMQEADDMKAATGIFDASLGAQSNETSGIAIQRRLRQSSMSNMHFPDNLSRVYRRMGRAIARLIPIYYDGPREIRILGADETQRVVRVNQEWQDEQGKLRHHRLDIGKYDVTVTTGPTYTTQRQEAFDMLTQFAQAYPQLLQIGGDIVFRNSDIPGGDELSERFKRMLPPNLQGDDKQGPAQIPPQIQAQLQGFAQQNEQLTQAVNVLTEEIKGKKYELDSRERIAAMQEETKRSIAFASLDQKDGITLLAQEIAALKGKYDQQHAAMLQQAQHQHEAMQQQAQQQHQAGLQQGQQDHQAGLQESQQQAAQLQQQQQPEAA